MKKLSDSLLRYTTILSCLLLLTIVLLSTTAYADNSQQALSELKMTINPGTEKHKPVTFKHILPNAISLSKQMMTIEVNSSASFTLLPFDSIKPVTRVDFEWSSRGQLKLDSASLEATREGDDARLRIGLVLLGENPGFINPLTPDWLKTVRKRLHFPSQSLIYLIAGARHSPGSIWLSPYNDQVTMIASKDTAIDDNWFHSSHTFTTPQPVIGLWIMADGDNTHSRFTTRLRKLVLTLKPDSNTTETSPEKHQ